MKKYTTTLLLILFNIFVSHSQYSNAYKSDFYFRSAVSDIYNKVNKYSASSIYNSYTGSPYYDKNFNSGFISNLKDGKTYNYLLRYNVYDDVFEIKNQENSIVQLSKKPRLKISLKNKKFVLTKYKNKESQIIGYLELILNNNNIFLYKRHQKILISARKAKSSYEKDKPARFNTSISFYYKLNNETIDLLPKKKKDFLKIFPNKSDKIKSYIKENKLKLSKPSDLQNIFKYYSSIIPTIS